MEPEVERAFQHAIELARNRGYRLTDAAVSLLQLVISSIGEDPPPWPAKDEISRKQSQLAAIEFLPQALRLVRQENDSYAIGIFQLLDSARILLRGYRGFAYP